MTMKKRLVSMKALRATTTSQMICLMCCMESLHTMTRVTMRVFKMDNNIKTKVVDLGRGKILMKITRLRMRAFKMDNNIETKVVELGRGKIQTKKMRLRMRVFKMDNNIKTQVVHLGRGKILTKKTRFRMRVFKIDNNIETIVVDSRMREIETTKNNKIKVLARLGKTVCLKAKGNNCGKRREIEVRQTGTRKRTRRVITNPTEATKKKTQQKRSINEERKRRKGRSSHQMVFDFTFYTDSV